ncbi:DNA primase [Candidatus Babeliales bacterium]|nr:DNA primase [Candidatus Babeliales bacterium]
MTLFGYLKSKLSILDVVLEYVQLKQAGHYWKGKCPFHLEKDASFTVSPDKQIFYCFGCHEGGDLVAFIAKVEGLSQIESAWHLIDRYRVTIPKELRKELDSNTDSQKEKKGFHFLCSSVAEWCYNELQNSPRAKKYLDSRSIDSETTDYFKVGFFPGGIASINRFIREMSNKGVLLKDLLYAGVLVQGGKVCYSPFEERIIFPISDLLGRPCGFGGRIYRENDERAKYYNSKESAYFQKGQLLFGFDLAKREMRNKEYAFLVEGYTDSVAMYQHGYPNVVATLGTACTEEHLKLLSRYVNTLYVTYDGDSAGQKAILRLVELCWNVDLDLKIIKFSATDDPASFLYNGGKIDDLIRNSDNIFSFFVELEGESFVRKSLSEKLKLSGRIVEVISRQDDAFKQDLLLQKASSVMQIPYESLKELLADHKGIVQAPPNILESVEENDNTSDLEKKILFAIINNMGTSDEFSIDEDLEGYFTEKLRFFLAKLRIIISNEDPVRRFNIFFESLDEDQKRWVSLNCLRFGGEITSSQLGDLLVQFRKQKWRETVADIRFKMLQAHKSQNLERLQMLTKQFVDLKDKMKAKGII